MIKVKVCGITNKEDAYAAVDAGYDALGFVFAESGRKIKPEDAQEIIRTLPPFVSVVGVFVNERIEVVKEISSFCQLDALQFHGEETPQYCLQFNKRVIKAFRIKDKSSLKDITNYKVSAYLLDTYSQERFGGTGKSFNWNLIKEIKVDKIILAGGLTPENVTLAIKTIHPYGVDVSSGVEREIGIKDHIKMKDFINRIRKLERREEWENFNSSQQ